MTESLRLFLVEDNDDVAYVMRRCLERAGHHVTACRSGADALLVLAHTDFDLVVLDYYLEDMSGLELLRTLANDRIDTPVLMVTGRGDEHLARAVLRAGALDYVVKDPSRAYLDELPKRVEESVTRHRLQQTNGLLVAALESARDGVAITDLQGTLLHVNSALEQMFGFDRRELLGASARIFGGDRPTEAPFEEMWRALREGTSWLGELIVRRKDGTPRDASLTVAPIADMRGRVTHCVSIVRDISERKQMERQLFQAQKMQSVGTLAGGVAHEFNNLLAGIQGYAALGLRERDVPAPLRAFLDQIVTLSDRAANLTRQLLAFARKPALRRQPTDLHRLLRETRDLVQRSLNIDVALEMPTSGGPWTALADAGQLQQVLVNLTLNARDALPQPSVPIAYRLRHRTLIAEQPAFPQNVPAGDYLVLEVEDCGTGMPPEVQAQALDPFFTTKEVGKGTGLGLAVAFGIVIGHQGHLTLDSEPGRGTCVRLYLPRLAEDVATIVPAAVPEPNGVGGHPILIVDDEAAVLDVVRRFLEIAGHRPSGVASGSEALTYLGAHPEVRMVLLDLMIPGEDGLANFRQLRELRPDVPVLLCTGLVRENEATELLREGAISLLRKPFRMSELWHAVSACLDGGGARSAP